MVVVIVVVVAVVHSYIYRSVGVGVCWKIKEKSYKNIRTTILYNLLTKTL